MAPRAGTMMETRKLAADTVLQNRYRILSLLKRGGMGRVYLAEDLRFRSRVAVKEAYLTDEEFAELLRAKRVVASAATSGIAARY